MRLSEQFLWGGASAANQCEGGYADGGKGPGTADVIPAGGHRRAVAWARWITIFFRKIPITLPTWRWTCTTIGKRISP